MHGAFCYSSTQSNVMAETAMKHTCVRERVWERERTENKRCSVKWEGEGELPCSTTLLWHPRISVQTLANSSIIATYAVPF